MPRRLTLLATAALALTVLLGACGSSSDDKVSADGSTTTAASGSNGADTGGKAGEDDDLTTKPTITIPDGDAPTEVKTEDLVVGTGEEAVAGKPVTVQYVGSSWSTGKEFDASWDRGQPFTFTLGGGQVIQGWDEGVAGMKVGGRRVITIPPDKGYGAAGAGADIGPNETLVFVVDLVEVG